MPLLYGRGKHFKEEISDVFYKTYYTTYYP